MSVRIRLRRMGAKKRPFYRIIVADSKKPRDGRYIESLGYYDPMSQPPNFKIEEDRLFGWLDNGAQPSDPVWSLLTRMGLRQKWEMIKRGEDISGWQMPEPKTKRTKKKTKAVAAAAEKAGQPQVEEKKEEEKAAQPEEEKDKEAQAPAEEKVTEAKAAGEEAPAEKKAAAKKKPEKPPRDREAPEEAAQAADSDAKVKAPKKKTSARKTSAAKADEKQTPEGES